MKTLHFSAQINAPVEKVWETMLGEAPYREWTDVFSPGSHFVGDWQEGSKMLFLAPQEGGGTGGMMSTIAENRPHEFLSIKHLGFVKNGVEDTESAEVQAWIGALENYTFRSENGGTTVAVDLDSEEQHTAYFEDTWPKALEKLKALAEA
jgi:hypothetical protein